MTQNNTCKILDQNWLYHSRYFSINKLDKSKYFCTCLLIGIIFFRWGFLIWELIFFYLLRTFCPYLGRFFFCVISAKFHFWPSSGDLPRPRIGMLSLVTVSPVITVFHSCFWHFLGRIWNRYLLTMLTWNRRDSTPLSAAPRAPKDGFFCLINPYLVFQSRVRTEFL